MAYFVYILKSKTTERHYTSYADNLKRRLNEYNLGRTASLIKHAPLEIIYKEEYKNIEEAKKRKKQIKKYKSGEAFKKLLNKVSRCWRDAEFGSFVALKPNSRGKIKTKGTINEIALRNL
ncbi:MAG: GIY-YIG nuclease family protein [Patescibacteria group bacterium]|nr:GIY-YIG nuclease family protein [Patescibacteria group bacterium]